MTNDNKSGSHSHVLTSRNRNRGVAFTGQLSSIPHSSKLEQWKRLIWQHVSQLQAHLPCLPFIHPKQLLTPKTYQLRLWRITCVCITNKVSRLHYAWNLGIWSDIQTHWGMSFSITCWIAQSYSVSDTRITHSCYMVSRWKLQVTSTTILHKQFLLFIICHTQLQWCLTKRDKSLYPCKKDVMITL